MQATPGDLFDAYVAYPWPNAAIPLLLLSQRLPLMAYAKSLEHSELGPRHLQALPIALCPCIWIRLEPTAN